MRRSKCGASRPASASTPSKSCKRSATATPKSQLCVTPTRLACHEERLRMKIVYSDKHAAHDPQTFFVRGVNRPAAEQPERATRLLAAATAAGHGVLPPKTHGAAPAAAVHTPQ